MKPSAREIIGDLTNLQMSDANLNRLHMLIVDIVENYTANGISFVAACLLFVWPLFTVLTPIQHKRFKNACIISYAF